MGSRSHRMVAVATGRLADGTAIAVTDAGYSPRVSAEAQLDRGDSDCRLARRPHRGRLGEY